MNQVLEVLYNYTQIEYIIGFALIFSLPLLLLAFSILAPKKVSIYEVVASLSVPISAIFFLVAQISLQLITNIKYSFDYQFVFTFLIVNMMLVVLISLNLKNIKSFLTVIFATLVMYIPIIYTGFVSINAVIIFLIPYIITSLILCLPLKKYYAKL